MLHFILPLMLHFHLNGWAEVSYRKSDVIYLPPFWCTIINKSLSDNMMQIYRLFWMLYFCCCKFSYILLSAEKMRECLCVIFLVKLFIFSFFSFVNKLFLFQMKISCSCLECLRWSRNSMNLCLHYFVRFVVTSDRHCHLNLQ